jgi:putative ABC transport system ATP-binding protein
LLQELNRQLHVTVLMVTHDREAAAIAGRQFQLVQGKLKQTGGVPAQEPVKIHATHLN